ncbi:MAG: hypothetical protein AAGA27_02725 [Pseudomonadota bacterium]
MFQVLNPIWLPLFIAAFISYFAYHYFIISKHNYAMKIKHPNTMIYFLIMGLLYFLPLIVYAKAVAMLGNLGSSIAWPLMMSFIIVASNILGWIRGEWNNCRSQAIKLILLSLVFTIFTVFSLGIAEKYNLHTYPAITHTC